MVHDPSATPSHDEDVYRNILVPWQRRLLTRLIQIFGVLGLVAVVPGIYAALVAGATSIVILDVVAYAALLPAYLLRNRWYGFSAVVVVALQLAVGAGLLVTVGVEAASMLWLLAPILIGNLLLRVRATVVVFVISLSVLGLVGVLLWTDSLSWSIPIYAWYAIVGTYITLAAILTIATRYLMDHLIQGILHEQELNHELDHRVRNNLQLVNSLIFLQSRQSEEIGAEEALEQLNTRVMAMGAAFSAVGRTDRSFRVPLARLLDLLFCDGGNVAIECCPVEVQKNNSVATVSVDTAVPVAIILAELVVAGRSCDPQSIVLAVTSHGKRDFSVSIRFRRPRRPRDPLIADTLSQDIVTALTGHVAGFYTEAPRGDDIELSLTFRD